MPGILLGVLGFLVVFPLLVVAGVGLQGLYQVFHHVPKDQDVVETLKNAHGALAKWMDGIFAAVVAPFAEETFFRGTLQTLLIQEPRGGGLLAANDWSAAASRFESALCPAGLPPLDGHCDHRDGFWCDPLGPGSISDFVSIGGRAGIHL